MANSEFKRQKAKLHNLRRDEIKAYEIHYKLYPEQEPMRLTTRRNRVNLAAIYAISAMGATTI